MACMCSDSHCSPAGVPYKTFSYININISEANLKKCEWTFLLHKISSCVSWSDVWSDCGSLTIYPNMSFSPQATILQSLPRCEPTNTAFTHLHKAEWWIHGLSLHDYSFFSVEEFTSCAFTSPPSTLITMPWFLLWITLISRLHEVLCIDHLWMNVWRAGFEADSQFMWLIKGILPTHNFINLIIFNTLLLIYYFLVL